VGHFLVSSGDFTLKVGRPLFGDSQISDKSFTITGGTLHCGKVVITSFKLMF
jgi:hypothetical protein